MSHPSTTDFDKYGGTFKVTATNTIKRTSNESHDDENKKLRLEKSGSSNILATSVSASQQSTNNIITIGCGPDSVTKKLKTRKLISGDGNTTSQHHQYQLIVEDSVGAGAFSEESCGGTDSTAKVYSTSGSGEDMLLIRKQAPTTAKVNESSDVGVEERVVHIEGDPGGTASSTYIAGISGKQTPKRLQIGIADAPKKSFGDGIDLKLITTNSDVPGSGKIQMLSGGDKKTEQLLLSVSSTSSSPQNTFTYSRVCSVSNVTGPTGESMNLKNLQGATVKNQSLVVSSKKLLPEVTQTTAKVSIGNTTISVPLLKPLSTSQIIHQGGVNTSTQSGPTESSKSVIHTIQTSSGQSPQAQLSKFLNIKRGQKGNQPTYVSLSQLQIKPVSSAKIVQAKVVSKKIPLQFQTVQHNKSTLLQQTSGVVTITSNKTDLQQIQQQSSSILQGQSPSPHKKQQHTLVKELTPVSIIKSTTSNSSTEDAVTSQTSAVSAASNTTDQTTTVITEKSQQLKSSSSSTDNSGQTFISSDFLPVGVKVVHASTTGNLNSGLRPSAGGHDVVDQTQSQSSQTTQRINIGPTISIVRQNSPQLVTTSGNLSTMSLSMADAASGQQKLILTKSQFANMNSSNINTTATSVGGNTVSSNFPRNISLMLTKTSTGQQVFTNAGAKTTLCVTTSTNNPNKPNTPTRMNLGVNTSLSSTTSSSSISTISVSSSTVSQNDRDSASANDVVPSVQECSNVQHGTQMQSTQQIPTNVVQNRKIIQVLPGGLYSSSGGSFVQISKSKMESDEEKKKSGDLEQCHSSANQHSLQQQLLTVQQQQQHQQQQINLQIQQQHQQPHHQTQQQVQTQSQTQISQSQQHRQQLLQRHQLLHKQQMQQQLQKQQQLQQQQIQHQIQQQTSSQNLDPSPTEPNQTQTSYTASNVQQSHIITPSQAPKSEDSNNVLLKQLLQNSNSTPLNNQSNNQHARSNSVATPTTVLPGRKVINVRAPSLGLVSSLEAQLARPVIPPVPASESSVHSTVVPTPMSIATTTQTSISKSVIDHTKISSPHVVHSSVSSSSSTTTNPSLIISCSKTLSQTQSESKPKFSSSPLISKETSFVSKPSLPDTSSDQNIEIFSLQTTTGESAGKASGDTPQRHPMSFDQTTFKACHSSPQNTTTNKITKYIQEIKKTGDQQQHHQQQQQAVSVLKTYGSGSNNKEKTSGNINFSTQSTTNVNQGGLSANTSQQIISGLQQTNKIVQNQGDSNMLDKNIDQPLQQLQSKQPQVSNQVLVQSQNVQQQDSTKLGTSTTNTESEDQNSIIQQYTMHTQNTGQMPQHAHQTQQQQNTTPSPMSTTPSNSVASTPTGEYQPPINIINKQQLLLQQHAQAQAQSHSPMSATSGSSPVTKDNDNRKKRKREQQKQRKQLSTSNAKETTTTGNPAANASISAAGSNAAKQKRSRKSLKMEEDYDSFIENLMLHLRQMPPMQVLEPQLNVNYGVCNMFGWRNCPSSSTSPQKESRQSERGNLFEQELEGEFGAAYIPNKVPFYDLNKFRGRKTSDDANTSSSIQNNYYDQEFSSFTYKSEPDKLNSWVKVYRERAVDTPEIISNKHLMPVDPVKTIRLNMLQQETFPGLILMSSSQQRMGRMSPVIPVVNSMALITKRKKTPLKPLENDADSGMYIKDFPDEMDHKGLGLKNNENSQNVILSLPTSSTERLLDVLKNLANLLQINTPIPYKLVEEGGDLEFEDKSSSLSARDREIALRNLHIQEILNGRYKMCRQCGSAIKGRCLKNNNDNTKSSLHAKLLHPTQPRYFCNKVCFVQFRLSQKKHLSSTSLRPDLAPQEEPNFDSDLMDDLLDIKPDVSRMLDEKKDVVAEDPKAVAEPETKPNKISFRYYSAKCFQPATPVKRMSERDIRDMLFKMNITMSATGASEPGGHQQPIEDRRSCVLCSQIGDGVADGPSRLLNYDVDKWVHLNCALWSTEVYETISGGLMNFNTALQIGLNQSCNTCQQLGATVKCYKTRCGAVFHLPCAIRDQCVFYQNKTIHCQAHASRNDKDKELPTLSVPRRVFVDRDENRQVAAIMHHSEMVNLLRVGSLIFLNVGQLLPHQLEAFHTPNCIYPIGFKIIRFYWSMRRPNKRCRYICSIAEVSGRPEFRILIQEPAEEDIEFRDVSPKAVWQHVLQSIAEMRRSHNLVKLYPEFVSGEDLFGLTEPAIVRIIESLPGVETLTNYRFKYGRNPLLDLPLALNPSGAARTEPKLRQLMGWKKHHPQRTCSSISSLGGHQAALPSTAAAGEVTCPYSKQFVHSKSSQYKKMKQEWRNNVYLARSKIAGLGLYAARDMEKHTMIIEYIGEVIRSEVSEIREKQYEARNRGIYMFRLDEDRVVDATLCGGLARYINHSCNPNCVTEIVEVDRELRIIIFAKRRINRSEELSYDYKFDIEDDGSKIPCMCGAPNCRKWMN
ncbi:histone-lysine N-methyltransferase trr [Musca vetustissima]|uniref:histone-lysine N-methyltransferase trr n=1 Tax=Musca vetustissima TaxID=27455 RepID=UPI002AB782A4|nr:histone-lysine N-methyltransferase trr [Musca vetustissima]